MRLPVMIHVLIQNIQNGPGHQYYTIPLGKVTMGIRKLVAASQVLRSDVIDMDAYISMFRELSTFLASLGTVCCADHSLLHLQQVFSFITSDIDEKIDIIQNHRQHHGIHVSASSEHSFTGHTHANIESMMEA